MFAGMRRMILPGPALGKALIARRSEVWRDQFTPCRPADQLTAGSYANGGIAPDTGGTAGGNTSYTGPYCAK